MSVAKNNLSRKERKLLRKKKLEDPLGIDEMSDEEFLANLPRFKRKVVKDGVGGFLLFIIVIVLFVVLWDSMF